MNSNYFSIEVSRTNKAIWVNSPISCVARFSKLAGAEVMEEFSAEQECLIDTDIKPIGFAKAKRLYTHYGHSDQVDFARFCSEVKKFHGFTVPPDALQF